MMLGNKIDPSVGIPTTIRDISRPRKTEWIEMTFTRTSENSGDVNTIVIPTIPQSISYTYSPKFASQQLLGRLTPIYQYMGAGGKHYSFSLELHEDVHTTQWDSLEDLVNDIKSLSTPRLDSKGVSDPYPRVLFQLGRLSAFVKVETNIEWKKPMRNGKYIMATVQFQLDVLEELEPIMITGFDEVVGKEVKGDYAWWYDGTINYVYTSKQSRAVLNIKDRYGVDLGNIITNKSSIINQATPTENWDIERERLNRLFGVYDSQTKSDKDKDALNKINKLWKELNVGGANIGMNYTQLEKKITELKTAHRTFMNYYYDNINLDMTRAEKEAIIQRFDAMLDSMLVTGGGILGYGATP